MELVTKLELDVLNMDPVENVNFANMVIDWFLLMEFAFHVVVTRKDTGTAQINVLVMITEETRMDTLNQVNLVSF